MLTTLILSLKLRKTVVQSCSVKKMLRPATLLKSRLWHRCFSVNFVKILRTRFFIEHLRRLLLEEKNNMMGTVNTVIPSRNLKINDDKTEHTFLQRETATP